MPRYLLKFALCLALAGFSAGAFAQVRAWLDRDNIRAGETVTLRVETSETLGELPDYSPLMSDFSVVNSDVSTRVAPGNGGLIGHTRYLTTLQPRRSGRLTIPSLRVGGGRTQPLTLYVQAEAAQPLDEEQQQAPSGADVFVEVVPDDNNPYVQQAVGWLVRLYAAVPVASGKLDQPVPDGASVMKVGDDAQYERNVGGRTYTVVERRYLLVPERSGRMTVPAALFDGRSAPGLIEQLTGDGGTALHARSKPRVLDVRAAPNNAPQPWLPLRSLELRYRSTPQQLRMGTAAAVVVEATVDGAGLAQLPDLQLPPVDGVQVFAEPVQADESFVGGRPRVKLTRKFSLVPSREGAVRLEGLRLDWWDVKAASARVASLPALSWTVASPTGVVSAASNPAVAAGAGGATGAAPVVASDGSASTDSSAGFAGKAWAIAAGLFALLWLATLVWALHLRSHPQRAFAQVDAPPAAAGPASLPLNMPALRQLIDTGDFERVAGVLRGLARPPAADDDELIERLADPAQRDAVQALRRARWGGGDGVAARNLLRAAFANPPQWRQASDTAASPLPPLYPQRK